MSNPYRKLQKMLQSGRPTSGEVIQVSPGLVRVMTSAGVYTYPDPGMGLSVGEEVRLSEDSIKGRLKKTENLPVFWV